MVRLGFEIELKIEGYICYVINSGVYDCENVKKGEKNRRVLVLEIRFKSELKYIL